MEKQHTFGYVKEKEKAVVWETNKKSNCASDCSWVEDKDNKKEVEIYLPLHIQAVISRLCKDIAIEWQMLLVGMIHNGVVDVSSYYIPEQEVSTANVKNLECIDKKFIEENCIIATIHSHGTMGTFFSSVDEEKTNLSLIKYHIVVNNDGDSKAQMQRDLPCGMRSLVDIDIVLEEEEEKVKVPIAGIEKIKTRKNSYQYPEITDKTRDILERKYSLSKDDLKDEIDYGKLEDILDNDVEFLTLLDFTWLDKELYVTSAGHDWLADEDEIKHYHKLIKEQEKKESER